MGKLFEIGKVVVQKFVFEIKEKTKNLQFSPNSSPNINENPWFCVQNKAKTEKFKIDLGVSKGSRIITDVIFCI